MLPNALEQSRDLSSLSNLCFLLVPGFMLLTSVMGRFFLTMAQRWTPWKNQKSLGITPHHHLLFQVPIKLNSIFHYFPIFLIKSAHNSPKLVLVRNLMNMHFHVLLPPDILIWCVKCTLETNFLGEVSTTYADLYHFFEVQNKHIKVELCKPPWFLLPSGYLANYIFIWTVAFFQHHLEGLKL